jgi:hypothetical protein
MSNQLASQGMLGIQRWAMFLQEPLSQVAVLAVVRLRVAEDKVGVEKPVLSLGVSDAQALKDCFLFHSGDLLLRHAGKEKNSHLHWSSQNSEESVYK